MSTEPTTFRTLHDQYREHNGKKCRVVKIINKPEDNPNAVYDQEVLPMYLLELEDGEIIDAWPDELHGERAELQPLCPRCDLRPAGLGTSRLDSKTHLCSKCDQAEAIEDHLGQLLPREQWKRPDPEAQADGQA